MDKTSFLANNEWFQIEIRDLVYRRRTNWNSLYHGFIPSVAEDIQKFLRDKLYQVDLISQIHSAMANQFMDNSIRWNELAEYAVELAMLNDNLFEHDDKAVSKWLRGYHNV